MDDTLPDDPWHPVLSPARLAQTLIEQGALGQKTKAGFYRKAGKDIQVLDPARAVRTGRQGRRSTGQSPKSSRSRIPAEKFARLRASRASAGAVPVGDLPRPFPLLRVPPGDHRRQRARRRSRDALGLRLADGTVRDLAGRGLEGGRRMGRRGHRVPARRSRGVPLPAWVTEGPAAAACTRRRRVLRG